MSFALIGCGVGSIEGPSRPADAKPTSPVTGSVKIDGAVPSGLNIYLVPAGSTDIGDIDEDFASAYSASPDGEGKFAFSTYVSGDGAPPGDYVAVMRWTPRGQLKPDSSAVESFNLQHGNPANSKLTVKVEADKATTLEPWDLKSN